MKRQKLLLWTLVVLLLLGLPMSLMDQAAVKARAELEKAQGALRAARRESDAVRERESGAALRTKAVAATRGRMIQQQPFATFQAQVALAAKRAGVTITSAVLESSQPLPDLPGVVQYRATLQVAGTAQQFVELLRLLEEHPMVLELPEVAVKFPVASGTGAAPRLQHALTVGFFAAQATQ